MSPIHKVGSHAGSLQASDTRGIDRKNLSKHAFAGKKHSGKSGSYAVSSPVVDEMKIALKKEGLGNFIDMLA
ncbi:MAG: hypothetical protein RBU23_08860 [Candidatus Auribacterota bacterium]|jgi:hypothetical protein|nr:hypothetical protein [Candidatus Auribacterota bacterium]